MATVTVMRSRFRSTTVEPWAAAPTLPPNMSERPPPFPLCIRMRKISPSAESTSMTMYTQVTASKVASNNRRSLQLAAGQACSA